MSKTSQIAKTCKYLVSYVGVNLFIWVSL